MHGRVRADEEFALYYDEALSRRTDYHADNRYFRDARERIDRTFGLIARTIPGSRVLDIGASPFYLLDRARALGAAECHGIYFANDEHPLKGVPQIHSRSGSIALHHLNVETDDLPFPDNSLDVITVCEILEHLDHFPFRLSREIHRVLRPGGTLVVTVPNVCRVGNIAKLIGQRNVYHKYRADHTGRHKHEYTLAETKALMRYLGMRIERAGYLGDSTSPRRWLRPLYRAMAAVPILRNYAAVIYAIGRLPDPKPALPATPPAILYTEALSIEA